MYICNDYTLISFILYIALWFYGFKQKIHKNNTSCNIITIMSTFYINTCINLYIWRCFIKFHIFYKSLRLQLIIIIHVICLT